MPKRSLTLGLARSNGSTALKELQGYAIVRRVHVEGERRDHFVAETDLWEMLMRISAGRKRSEIDPTIALFNELSVRLAADDRAPKHLRERVRRMHEFMSTLAIWLVVGHFEIDPPNIARDVPYSRYGKDTQTPPRSEPASKADH